MAATPAAITNKFHFQLLFLLMVFLPSIPVSRKSL
jgi:hypothetical protein